MSEQQPEQANQHECAEPSAVYVPPGSTGSAGHAGRSDGGAGLGPQDVHVEVIDGSEHLLVLTIRNDGTVGVHAHMPPLAVAGALREVAQLYEDDHRAQAARLS